MTQFWRQWHISLSTWLRDYLYIPLGGSRVSEWRIQVNLLLTMLLGGVWHGASFTFAAWGLYHGLLLVCERAIGEARLSRVPAVFRHLSTILLIALGWTLFRSENFGQAQRIFEGMSGIHGLAGQFNTLLIGKNTFAAGLALVGFVFCIVGERWLVTDRPLASQTFAPAAQWGLCLLFLVALLVALSSVEIPFLYFQF